MVSYPKILNLERDFTAFYVFNCASSTSAIYQEVWTLLQLWIIPFKEQELYLRARW